MSMAEIIPAVRALPRSEKFKLAQLLLDDLAREELLSGIEQGQESPIYTPPFAPGAAAQLAMLGFAVSDAPSAVNAAGGLVG